MLTKKQQTAKKARLRDDVSQLLKDKEYLAYLHSQQLRCFSCGGNSGIELHHIKRCSSDKKNDHQVIPLCGVSCHRLGVELSAHGTPKKWREVYPISVQLEYAERLFKTYKER